MPHSDSSDASGTYGSIAHPPSLALPKGGGAVRGIGEKFAANPVTGTGSLTIPIATSPGRSGFGPRLAISYDSGSGNGPFGLGWDLSLPAITRKTDKGLPRYCDAEESDVFLLSGSEDLVPELTADGTRYEDTTRVPGYTIHRYRPRIEGLFARIERWTRDSDGDVHWRSISKDNILTLYGRDANAAFRTPTIPAACFPGSSPRPATTRATPSSTSTSAGERRRRRPDQGLRAQSRRQRRPAPPDQPLSQAHPLRQPRTPARRDRKAPTIPDQRTDRQQRQRCLDVRGRLRLRRARRERPDPGGCRRLDLPPRPLLDLPRRLRGAHLPSVPAGVDVPSLPGRDRRRCRLPGSLHRLYLPLRANTGRSPQSDPLGPHLGHPMRLPAQARRRLPQALAAAGGIRVQRGRARRHRPASSIRRASRTCPTASTARPTSGRTWTATASPAC